MPVKPAGHIGAIDSLRGIAAFAVCWYHLTGFPIFQPIPWLRATGQYGWLGVQIFFVISGFIIPYSLFRVSYRIDSFWRFLARRLIRLDPPYFATIALVVGFNALVAHTRWHQGAPFQISWLQLLAHIGYANAFVKLPWIVEVFWTLAIEFQYYVSIGLLYFTLIQRRRAYVYLFYAAAAALSFSSRDNAFLPHHLPLFLIGIAIFRYRSLKVSAIELACGLGLALTLAAVTNGLPQALAGALAGASILWFQYSNAILRFLGKISYSLYLTHAFTAGIVMVQGAKLLGTGPGAQITLIALALSAVLACAYVLYALVENPSKEWASRVRYGTSLGAGRPAPMREVGAL